LFTRSSLPRTSVSSARDSLERFGQAMVALGEGGSALLDSCWLKSNTEHPLGRRRKGAVSRRNSVPGQQETYWKLKGKNHVPG